MNQPAHHHLPKIGLVFTVVLSFFLGLGLINPAQAIDFTIDLNIEREDNKIYGVFKGCPSGRDMRVKRWAGNDIIEINRGKSTGEEEQRLEIPRSSLNHGNNKIILVCMGMIPGTIIGGRDRTIAKYYEEDESYPGGFILTEPVEDEGGGGALDNLSADGELKNYGFPSIRQEGDDIIATIQCQQGWEWRLFNKETGDVVKKGVIGENDNDDTIDVVLPKGAVQDPTTLALSCRHPILRWRVREDAEKQVALSKDGELKDASSGSMSADDQGNGKTKVETEICPESDPYIHTVIGDIPCRDLGASVGWLLKRAITVAASAAFLLIILGGYYILASQGSPDRIGKGKQLVTNAVLGLLFIILSAMMIRFIGHEIINIPFIEGEDTQPTGGGGSNQPANPKIPPHGQTPYE